jgi:hypothetical protein
MLPPKKKRVRTWCPGGGKCIDFQFDEESRKLCLTPEKRKVKYARCTVCNQRFEVYYEECHDAGCVHSYIPKHKAY